MSGDNLNVHTVLTATDQASQVVRKFLATVKELESVGKRLNGSFAGIGRAGVASMAQFDRVAKNAASQMQGLGNVAERAASSYRSAWAKADQDREKSASRMYASLMREEREYQSLLAKRSSSAGTSSRGGGASMSRIAGGTFLGVGAATAVRQLGRDVVAAERSVSRAVTSAFKERIGVAKSETQAGVFADLSGEEIRKLRKDYLDRLSIKFGTGIEGTLNVATELGKAGIDKRVLGDATELALKAKQAMDISEKETAELFGGLASFVQFDTTRYASISNSIAIANKDTKASGTQIVEGLKRGLSAIATTGGKLSPEQLAGLVGAAIDVGIQPGKSGNFISHIVGAVGSADSVHGQRAKDMREAAGYLGFGGRAQMAQAMRSNPMESLYQILDNLVKLPEKMRIRVAKDLGGEQWFDEILQMTLAKDKLKQIERDIATDTGFLDKASLKAIKSMSGAYASVMAIAKLAEEKLGGGFDKAFTEIADAILRHAETFNFDSITTHVEAFIDGLKEGFGFKDWGEAVDSLAGIFDAGSIQKWKDFGRGLAEGFREIADDFKIAFNALSFVSSAGNGNAETLGKLAADITGLAVALAVLAPVLLTLTAFTGIVRGLAGALGGRALLGGGSVGTAAWLALLLARNNDTGLSDTSHKLPGETTSQWRERQKKHRELQRYKPSGGDPLFAPTSYVTDSINKLSANIQRTSFLSYGDRVMGGGYGGGGGIQTAFAGGGGRYGSTSSSRSPNVMSLLRSTPGATLPNMGIGPSGSIIHRGGGFVKVPSFGANTAGGPADMSIGQGLSGNQFLAAQRSRFDDEMKNDPALKEQVAGMMLLEGAKDPVPVVESLFNRMSMTGGALRKGLYSGFYGPINRGQLPGAIARLRQNPKLRAKMYADIDAAIAGSNEIKGATDQGLPTDPNGRWMGGRIIRGGNVFNDWGGGRWHGLTGHAASKAFREDQQRRVDQGVTSPIGSVPTPSDAVRNVPVAPLPGAGAGDARMAPGQVAIHINGGSHDPEALATLVQRRIDESMNWRAHDTESEYT